MKRLMAALAVSTVAVLAVACDRAEPAADADQPAEMTATHGETHVAADPAVPPASSAAPAAPDPAADQPGSTEAPPFAVVYPGASLDAPPVTASGPAGPGGLVTYTTEADPDTVIAFYRARAESAGLSSVMAMNQGEARAYGAAKPGVGANLQVVAAPTEAGDTSVQLSWSAGQ